MSPPRAGTLPASTEKSRLSGWLPHLACGICVALVAEIWLPGQDAREYVMAALLSVGGAFAGAAAARFLLPGDLLKPGGFFLATIGALAALLLHAVVAG
ncbi:MAG: hypothetical protein HY821_24975 [Acidobacteria bacterium]|nr:hypothetical protein [Acidobacteriota bacterium]